MTPRQPIGVWPGEGGSHREFSLLLLVVGESYMTPSCTATHFFIAIKIRINNVRSLTAGDTYDIQVTNRKHGWILILPPL
jgi:hypothetical protein